MTYNIKKIIETDIKQLGIMPFTDNKMSIKNGYLYCYVDAKERPKKTLRLGIDRSILIKNIAFEKDVAYAKEPVLSDDYVYHVIRKTWEKYYIIKEDKDLNCLSIYNLDEGLDICRVHFITDNNEIVFTGKHHKYGEVLCQAALDWKIRWYHCVRYGYHYNRVVIPLENGKTMISALDADYNLESYHIVNKDGYLLNIIHAFGYDDNPIKDNNSEKVLIHTTMPWCPKRQYILHKIRIMDPSGYEIARHDIKHAMFIYRLINERYIIHDSGFMSQYLHLYDLKNRRDDAKITLSKSPFAAAFIKKIIGFMNDFVVIISKDTYFEIICLDILFQQKWKFTLKGDLVDADFVNGYLYYITSNKAGIYKLI